MKKSSQGDEEQTSAIPSSTVLKDSSLRAEPSFTPAPWRYYTGKLRPQFSTVIHEIQNVGGTAIVSWGGFDGVDFSQEEIAANARLIAAAPAMYEALQKIYDCGSIREAERVAASALALARGDVPATTEG